jgi:TPR repeat protein
MDKEAKDLFNSVADLANDGNIPLDYSESFNRLGKAAEKGSVTALYLLSHAFESGMGAASDREVTAHWHETVVYRKAGAGQFDSGAITARSYAEAFESFRHAAEMGDASAQLYMGLAYCFGQDVPVNVKQGVRWFEKAAAQGSTSAENNLGVLYHNGEGIPKDNATAVEWLDKAARSGNAVAQYNLGRLYLTGDGATQDFNLASSWLVRSAERENEPAQVLLSSMYATGNGVSGSLPTAYMWLNLASATDKDARAARDKIEKLVPPDQVAEGQRLTRDWIARNPQVAE